MADLTIDFSPDGPTATWLLSGTPTRARGEQLTMTLGFAPSDSSEYDTVVDRLGWTDPIWTGVNRNGVPWVREEIPSRASFSSQIYEVTPGSDINSFDSFWAVLTGGSDESDPPRGIERANVRLVFLADGSQYSNRSALKNDIGVSSI